MYLYCPWISASADTSVLFVIFEHMEIKFQPFSISMLPHGPKILKETVAVPSEALPVKLLYCSFGTRIKASAIKITNMPKISLFIAYANFAVFLNIHFFEEHTHLSAILTCCGICRNYCINFNSLCGVLLKNKIIFSRNYEFFCIPKDFHNN